MKNIFTVLFLAFFAHSVYGQEIISIEKEGNLGALNPCGCIELSEVTNQNNPADILIGMRECIELKEFEKAVKLFAIAGVYGKYDSYRVKDKTAHQAISVLQQSILQNVDENDKKILVESLQRNLKEGSEELDHICLTIRQVGAPEYDPKYMPQHGIQAFINEGENGVVKKINSKKNLDSALKEYLHCKK